MPISTQSNQDLKVNKLAILEMLLFFFIWFLKRITFPQFIEKQGYVVLFINL